MVEVTDLLSGQTERHSAVPWAVAKSDGSNQTSAPKWEAQNGRGLEASIPADGILALWDTARAQEIGRVELAVEPDAATLAFDAQGRRLAATVSGGVAYVINVDPDSWRTLACNLVARQLTESEKATYLGSLEMPDGCP
jgi:hypothetical protein